MPVCLWSGTGRVSSTTAGPLWGSPAPDTLGPGWPGLCRQRDCAWCSAADWQAGQSESCLYLWAKKRDERKEENLWYNKDLHFRAPLEFCIVGRCLPYWSGCCPAVAATARCSPFGVPRCWCSPPAQTCPCPERAHTARHIGSAAALWWGGHSAGHRGLWRVGQQPRLMTTMTQCSFKPSWQRLLKKTSSIGLFFKKKLS